MRELRLITSRVYEWVAHRDEDGNGDEIKDRDDDAHVDEDEDEDVHYEGAAWVDAVLWFGGRVAILHRVENRDHYARQSGGGRCAMWLFRGCVQGHARIDRA